MDIGNKASWKESMKMGKRLGRQWKHSECREPLHKSRNGIINSPQNLLAQVRPNSFLPAAPQLSKDSLLVVQISSSTKNKEDMLFTLNLHRKAGQVIEGIGDGRWGARSICTTLSSFA